MQSLHDSIVASAKNQQNVGFGLVVQGGGMRGVYSMGALAGLEEAGLTTSFDSVSGASAGAINGAYFIAGQAAAAVDVYVEALSRPDFVNLARPWRVVDIDYMIDVALKQYCPLDVGTVQAAPTQLNIVLTNAFTGQREVFSNRSNHDLYELFRATSALPLLYGKTVNIGEQTYLDGGIVDSIPVSIPLERGSTDILTVLTRPSSHRSTDSPVVLRWILELLAWTQPQGVRRRIGRANEAYNESLSLLDGVATPHGVHVSKIAPRDLSRLVSRTTKDRAALRSCAELGRTDMLRALGDGYPKHPAS